MFTQQNSTLKNSLLKGQVQLNNTTTKQPIVFIGKILSNLIYKNVNSASYYLFLQTNILQNCKLVIKIKANKPNYSIILNNYKLGPYFALDKVPGANF